MKQNVRKVEMAKDYTNSLVNADLFYANFTNKRNPIPRLTRTMKQKVLR